MKLTNVKPADGKLGIMVVGCGAVATTFMTGVLMVRKGLAKPVGSMTQYDKIRVGKGTEKNIYIILKLYHLLNLTTLFSVHGIFIHRMLTKAQCMQKF